MLIDAAIESGKTAGEVAHSILIDRSVSMGHKSAAMNELSDAIVAGINARRGETSFQVDRSEQSSAAAEITELIAASANEQPGRQPLNKKKLVSQDDDSLVDQIAAAGNINRKGVLH